ncbi:MAG: MFS transporter [Dysgonamonadaceae bacterium]|jgi:GPH family glycoside/pentoside/hexuronide:cation symporter|nr:MFS transporter [Dysgonamonadaceae bacterium]
MKDIQKIPFLEKFAYGLGDMACNLFWALIGTFAAIFYTDYFGITAVQAATMLLVIRCIDICFDVVIGAMADRMKTKYGRFRPWILYGAVPFCIIGFITFYTPEFTGWTKLLYAYITYGAFMLMYSVVNVPYGALMGVMSAHPDERTGISAYRNVLAQAGCFVVYGSTLTFVEYFSKTYSPQTAFSIVVGIYAVIAFISLLFCFFQTKERVEPVHEEKNKLSDDIKDLGRNNPWIFLTLAGIAMLFFTVIHSSLTTYYAKYYVANMSIIDNRQVFSIEGTFFGKHISWETFSSLLLSLGAIITIIGTILVKPVVSKYGKKKVWIGCFILASFASVSFAFIPKTSLEMIVLMQILFTICIGPTGFIMWSMYADVADDSEVKTGRRATGLIYSSATMAQKLGNTISGSLGLYALGAIGFVANDVNMPEDIRNSIAQIFAWVPLIASVLGIIALIFYKLDNKTIEENAKTLEEMKKKSGM